MHEVTTDKIHDTLIQIRREVKKGNACNVGICCNLYAMYWRLHTSNTNKVLHNGNVVHYRKALNLSELFINWPKFSGNIMYPIKIGKECPNTTFVDTRGNMYDPTTEYGALRLELLDWLIEETRD